MWLGTQEGLNRYDGVEFRILYSELDNNDSLPNSHINCIYESPVFPGVLWIGTMDGLAVYDSRREKVLSFRNSGGFLKSFAGVRVKAIAEAPGGTLWIATEGHGLFRIPLDKLDHNFHASPPVSQYQNNGAPDSPLPENVIHCLAVDSRRVIWLGMDSRGLASYNTVSNKWKQYTLENSDPGYQTVVGRQIRALCFSRSGALWIGLNGGGVVVMERSSSGEERFSCFRPSGESNAKGGVLDSAGQIFCIIEDSKNNMWFGSRFRGLAVYRRKDAAFHVFQALRDQPFGMNSEGVYSLYEDRAGSVWAGTVAGGANVLHPLYKDIRNYSPRQEDSGPTLSNNIWAMAEDRDGDHLWLSSDRCVYRFSIHDEIFEKMFTRRNPAALFINRLSSALLCDRNGDLWLSVDNEGVIRFTPPDGQVKRYKHVPGDPGSLSSNFIDCIFEDSGGDIWMGSQNGVNRLRTADRENPRFSYYRNSAEEPDSAAPARIIVIAEDRNKTIWAGAFGKGLWQFRRNQDHFVSFRRQKEESPTLSDNRVVSLYCADNGVVWIGTYRGLSAFDPLNNRWKSYTTADGLPNNVIYSVLGVRGDYGPDDAQLWVSTNRGISCFDVKTGVFHNYDILDGLQSNEFNKGCALKTASGLLAFGGVNGINIFDPRRIRDNPYIPPVALTDFLLFNQRPPVRPKGGSPLRESITSAQRVELSHTENFFSFRFAALNYINPAKNHYAYKLEGFDNEWIHSPANLPATYTSVPPGEYLFRVKGSNNENIWNDSGVSVQVVIRPPYWAAWWFRFLAISFIVFLLLTGHKMRTNAIKGRMEKRNLETELRMKADFTAMLAHDLRSPLNAVSAHCDLLEQNENASLTDFKKAIRAISISCGKMLALINDMLDLSRLEAGKLKLDKSRFNLIPLAEDVLTLMEPVARKKNVHIDWSRPVNPGQYELLADRGQISQVVHNLVDNALKFAPDGSTVVVGIRPSDNGSAEFSAADEGLGVPEKDIPLLFEKYVQLHNKTKEKGTGLGLAVSKLIIEAHGGQIGYRPRDLGPGAVFYFQLPLAIPSAEAGDISETSSLPREPQPEEKSGDLPVFKF